MDFLIKKFEKIENIKESDENIISSKFSGNKNNVNFF